MNDNKVKKDRFAVKPDGSIDITANISHAELCDLAADVADFSKEAITASFSDRARTAFSGILNAVSKFFPDEFENRQMVRDIDRQQGR